MAAAERIRVGLVGANPKRGFAAIAHIPALRALPQFEIRAVCTSRQQSADAAAAELGARHAFADAAAMARHGEVDLVAVCVKAPDHFAPVMAAIEAGKPVFCEWPLGRTTAEAIRMRDAAARRGVINMVGLQGQVSPAIAYARDLIAENYLGRVLSATMVASAPGWGAMLEGAYQADAANGATLLSITGGHTLDALCHCLGEFRELGAFVVSQRDRIAVAGTGETVPKTAPDQVAGSGVLASGAVVAFQVRAGVTRGTNFLLEIHGENGDLVLAAPTRASMQRQELTLKGAQGAGAALADLPIPARYRWVPDTVPADSPYNVAQLYARLAEAIRAGKPASPGFEAAVTRHKLLDAIVRASETGEKVVGI